MVITNEPGVTGLDYRDVLRRANLEDEFEEAWGIKLTDDRVESGLDSVSEHRLIEETLKEAEGLWNFEMVSSDRNEMIYTVTPIETDEYSIIHQKQIESLLDTLKTIIENRPDDPEIVSYSLDDLERQINEMTTR